MQLSLLFCCKSNSIDVNLKKQTKKKQKPLVKDLLWNFVIFLGFCSIVLLLNGLQPFQFDSIPLVAEKDSKPPHRYISLRHTIINQYCKEKKLIDGCTLRFALAQHCCHQYAQLVLDSK